MAYDMCKEDWELTGGRVLVLSRNSHNLSILHMILRMLRVDEIVAVNDKAAAEKHLRCFAVDAVIADWDTDSANTIVFMNEYRNGGWAYKADAPVIVVGSEMTPRDVAVLSAIGVSEVLLRPCSVNAMRRKIEAALSRPQVQIEVDGYRGPDRRRARSAPPDGVERRYSMLREEAVAYAERKAEDVRRRAALDGIAVI